MLDFDMGALTLKNQPDPRFGDVSILRTIPVCRDCFKSLPTPTEQAETCPKRGEHKHRSVHPAWEWMDILEVTMNPWKYRPDVNTLWFDSYTYMVRDIWDGINKAKKRNPSNLMERPTIDDWQVLIERVRVINDKVRQMPLHVYATAHVEVVKDGMEIVDRQVLVPGKDLPSEVPACFDFVAWFRKSGEDVLLDFVGSDSKSGPAKARQGYKVLRAGEKPDFDVLYKKLASGEIPKHNPAVQIVQP